MDFFTELGAAEHAAVTSKEVKLRFPNGALLTVIQEGDRQQCIFAGHISPGWAAELVDSYKDHMVNGTGIPQLGVPAVPPFEPEP